MEYELRYKHSKRGIIAIRHSVAQQATPAATQARAEASARVWCGSEPGRQYISTQLAIRFTCSNLDEPAPIVAETQPGLPIAAQRPSKG